MDENANKEREGYRKLMITMMKSMSNFLWLCSRSDREPFLPALNLNLHTLLVSTLCIALTPYAPKAAWASCCGGCS